MNGKKMKRKLAAVCCFFFFGAGALLPVESGPSVPEAPAYAHLSIGSGYGLNYGGIGLGFEFNPRLPEKFGTGFHKYVSFVMGLGYMPDGGLAYSFGLHLYPLGRDGFLQPRLSAQYGVVAVLNDLYAYPGDERRAEGAALGAGFLLRLTRQIFLDADAHYILPVDYAMEELAGERVRFSAGLRYRL
jgi:hypothetical protein